MGAADRMRQAQQKRDSATQRSYRRMENGREVRYTVRKEADKRHKIHRHSDGFVRFITGANTCDGALTTHLKGSA